MRPSTKEIKDYTLERAEIKVQSVKGERLLAPELTGPFKIGYVRLIQFNEPTADELSKALDELQKQGMQALILDLRNNPGGLLNSAVDVCAQFLPPNTKVVSTQGRVASQQHDYSTSGASKERPHFPMAVLVNEGSASGAEIVAGALKDLHRAILVGETTFRKRFGPERDAVAGRLGAAFHDREILHAEQTGDSRQWRVAEHSRADERRTGTGAFCGCAAAANSKPDDENNFIKTNDPQMLRAIDALKGVMIYAQQNAPKPRR